MNVPFLWYKNFGRNFFRLSQFTCLTEVRKSCC